MLASSSGEDPSAYPTTSRCAKVNPRGNCMHMKFWKDTDYNITDTISAQKRISQKRKIEFSVILYFLSVADSNPCISQQTGTSFAHLTFLPFLSHFVNILGLFLFLFSASASASASDDWMKRKVMYISSIRPQWALSYTQSYPLIGERHWGIDNLFVITHFVFCSIFICNFWHTIVSFDIKVERIKLFNSLTMHS